MATVRVITTDYFEVTTDLDTLEAIMTGHGYRSRWTGESADEYLSAIKPKERAIEEVLTEAGPAVRVDRVHALYEPPADV